MWLLGSFGGDAHCLLGIELEVGAPMSDFTYLFQTDEACSVNVLWGNRRKA